MIIVYVLQEILLIRHPSNRSLNSLRVGPSQVEASRKGQRNSKWLRQMVKGIIEDIGSYRYLLQTYSIMVAYKSLSIMTFELEKCYWK